MNIALVLWDECHSRLSLFPILGDGAKHLACWCKPLRAKKQPPIFCPSSSFKHVAFTKWNLYDFPDIQNFLNDVNSAWINIHWKKARTNLLLFSVGEKGFQVRRKHFSSDIFSVCLKIAIHSGYQMGFSIWYCYNYPTSYGSPSIFWLSKRPMFNA